MSCVSLCVEMQNVCLPVRSIWCFTYRQTDHWSRSTAQCSTLLFGRWSQSRLILVDGWPPGWTSWFKWNDGCCCFFLTVLPIGEKEKKNNALWEASVISIFPVDAATVSCHSTRFVVQRLVGFTRFTDSVRCSGKFVTIWGSLLPSQL